MTDNLSTIYRHDSLAYSCFSRCMEGLKRIRPNYEAKIKFSNELSFTRSDYAAAYFRYNSTKGFIAYGGDTSEIIEILATMIHEFAHVLNFIDDKKENFGKRKPNYKLAHGKYFREACKELADAICTDEEEKLIYELAFDAPYAFRFSNILLVDKESGEAYLEQEKYAKIYIKMNGDRVESIGSLRETLGNYGELIKCAIENKANSYLDLRVEGGYEYQLQN